MAREGWSIIFSVPPRAVVEKRQGKFSAFVFSTGSPEGMMKVINEGLDRKS